VPSLRVHWCAGPCRCSVDGRAERADGRPRNEDESIEPHTGREVIMTTLKIADPVVVSRAEWLEARKKLLIKEKSYSPPGRRARRRASRPTLGAS
jgi:hypothetical protein